MRNITLPPTLTQEEYGKARAPRKKKRLRYSSEETKLIEDFFKPSPHGKKPHLSRCRMFLEENQKGSKFQHRSEQLIQDKVYNLILAKKEEVKSTVHYVKRTLSYPIYDPSPTQNTPQVAKK